MAGNVFGLKVFDERIEAGVSGHDIKSPAGSLGGQAADVVSDVEIERVAAAALDQHQFGIGSDRQQGGDQAGWNFRLVGSAKDLDLAGATTKRRQVLRLNVLEVYEDDVRFHAANNRFEVVVRRVGKLVAGWIPPCGPSDPAGAGF